MTSDLLFASPELPEAEEKKTPSPKGWTILIVDDEPDIHAMTRMVLSRTTLKNRGFDLHSAHNAEEAREFLRTHKDVALVLLDVVMETDDAGLVLASWIRHELKNSATRILLRTGQPGRAPEREVIFAYDINGYNAKSELTAQKLITDVVSALRAYGDIVALEKQRRGFATVIGMCQELLQSRAADHFYAQVLRRLEELLEMPLHAVLYTDRAGGQGEDFKVLAGTGRYAALQSFRPGGSGRLAQAGDVSSTRPVIPDGIAYHLHGVTEPRLVLHIDRDVEFDTHDLSLAEVYCSTVSLIHSNLHLYDQVSHLAYNDSLTGLPNRIAFQSALKRLQPDSDAASVRVLVVGIDRLADINSSFGYSLGDQLLKAVAARLKAFADSVPHIKILARLSGDTFGIVFHSASPSDRYDSAAADLLDVFRVPFTDDKVTLHLTASIGIAQMPEHTASPSELGQLAEIALAAAKADGKNTVSTFRRGIVHDIRRRTDIVERMIRGIRRSEFRLFLQPQIDLSTGEIIGAECLIRWPSADGTSVSPSEFIPIAEQAGLIVPLGQWIFAEACAMKTQLERAGHEKLRLGVNISAIQLLRPEIADMLRDTIARFGVSASTLELEITETAFAGDTNRVLQTLNEIRSIGFEISIDDFGTGESSLARLKALPIDRIKIDQSFITRVTSDGHDAAIARSIISLTRSLNLQAVAEGVEKAEHLEFLRAEGCHQAQGFLIAPPMPLDEMLRFMKTYRPI